MEQTHTPTQPAPDVATLQKAESDRTLRLIAFIFEYCVDGECRLAADSAGVDDSDDGDFVWHLQRHEEKHDGVWRLYVDFCESRFGDFAARFDA